jgi:peptidoglycan/LPS O-acetylase OafA/YrhL
VTAHAPQRRADLDLLRVLAVLLLFPFHSAKVYDPQPWYHVWSADLIPGLQHATRFVHLWHMPLLFLLAGWSAVASLRSRGLGDFLRERKQRLLLPLLFGVVLLCPIVKYYELRSGVSIGLTGVGAAAWLQQAHGALQLRPLPVAPPFDESFLAFLPTFFTPARITWSHLWFVAYLLVFSVAYAPLLARLARRGAAIPRPGLALWLPALLLAASEIVLRPHWPGVQTLVSDWANVVKYSLYLLAGALLATDPRLEARARAQWPAALGAGALLAALPLLPGAASGPVRLGAGAVAGWCLVVAALGAAARFARPGPRLAWLAAGSMQIYVLHQLGVVLAAWWIDPLPLPAGVRLALVLVASTAGVLAFYAWVVRPLGWLDAALGGKAARQPSGRSPVPGRRYSGGTSPRPAPAQAASSMRKASVSSTDQGSQ